MKSRNACIIFGVGMVGLNIHTGSEMMKQQRRMDAELSRVFRNIDLYAELENACNSSDKEFVVIREFEIDDIAIEFGINRCFHDHEYKKDARYISDRHADASIKVFTTCNKPEIIGMGSVTKCKTEFKIVKGKQ